MATAAIAISADEFVQIVKDSVKDGEYQFHASDRGLQCVAVAGSIDFTALAENFPKGLVLEDVHFRDAVKMTNCKFASAVSFRSCKFEFSLDLGKTTFENGLCFAECEFGVTDKQLDHTVLTLDDARSRGDIALYKSIVYGSVMARRLRLSGNLEFAACMLKADSKDIALLDLSNSRINGSIIFETKKRPETLRPRLVDSLANAMAARKPRLHRSRFANRKGGTSINLGGAEVTEDVNLSCACFTGSVDLTSVNCRGLTSEAGFFALRRKDHECTLPIQKTLVAGEGFGGAIIEGSLSLSGGKFGLIHLHGLSIFGEMSLIDGRSGQIHIEDSICNGSENERFVATTVLGNFVMIRWHCRDFVQLHPNEMKGSPNEWGIRGIVINSTKIDRALSFWPGLSLQRTLQTYMPPSAGDKPRPIFFTHEMGVKQADTEAGPEADPECRKLIDAETDPECRKLLNRWQRQLVVHGNINIEHSTIGDDVVLTGADVRENVGLSDGRIEILNSKIGNEVIFRSPISFLADSRMTAPLLHLLARRLVVDSDPQGSGFGRAICHTLDMRGLQAKKIDLTGLCIRKAAEKGAALAPNPANLRVAHRPLNLPNAALSHLRVDGRLATFARLASSEARKIVDEVNALLTTPNKEKDPGIHIDPTPGRRNWERELLTLCNGQQAQPIQAPATHLEASTQIPGSLDLQHAEIGELVISDASFREHPSKDGVTENGIILDYAQISKLYVARSELDAADAGLHNGFPVPVSLADLSVKSWFLEDEDAPESLQATRSYIQKETAIADPYLDLLDNDPVFRMSSYLAVEKSLRDRGFTEEAREIFIAGMYRDVRTKSAKGSRPESTNWRRGDGRLRNAVTSDWVLALLLFLIFGAAAAYFRTDYLTKNYLHSVAGAAAVLLIIFALRSNVFRLKRQRREYVGFIVCAAWCAAAIYGLHAVAVFMAGAFPHGFALLAVSLAALLAVGMALSGALRLFIDQLYWSLVDYGTSAWRLAGVILVLMAVSFALVSPVKENFAPTLLARSVPVAQQKPPITDSPQDWPFGKRLWMTLRYHVPLVGAVISEEWQPADQPLLLAGTTVCGQGASSSLCDYWPTAQDWYGLMLWTNWLLWPLFLPFLIRTLSRER